jgi:hypothetical protein
MWSTYLIAVHFELAHDLDSHFTNLSSRILCAVDIAECAIAHFLHQNPTVKTRVLRHLRPACSLLLNETFDFHGPIALHLSVCFWLGGLTITSHITLVKCSEGWGELAKGLWLLFSVDGGHVGGRFGMGRHEASLFPMPDEVLNILYRTHDERIEGRKRKKSMSRGPVRDSGKKRKFGRASDVGWLGSQRIETSWKLLPRHR